VDRKAANRETSLYWDMRAAISLAVPPMPCVLVPNALESPDWHEFSPSIRPHACRQLSVRLSEWQ
jgi:hypothetical protein